MRKTTSAGCLAKGLAAGLALVLGGCASSGVEHAPAARGEAVETERLVQMPFDAAWDDYVAELSRSFFVINNIARDSRIINVSFAASRPSDYVDCGTTTRTARAPQIGEQRVSYPAADSSRFPYGIEGTNLVGEIVRETALEGRVNVYMAPEGEATLLRVNARYVLNGTARTYDPRSPVPFTESWSGSFSSGERGRIGDGVEGYDCVSTGRLERELLGLI